MERNPLLDNAKFILIFFVVFGHMIEPIISTDPIIKTIYLSIYSFHMPAFIVISGMLAKDGINLDMVLKAIKFILLPFVIFTVFYEIFNYIVKGDVSSYSKNLQPYWILWFLYSLFLWKLMLPIFLKFKFPITISILMAIGAGYFESIGYFLGLSRTLYFFPFFIIGYRVSSGVLTAIREKYNSIIYLLIPSIIILFNLIFFTLFNDMQHQWLYGSYSYQRLGNEDFSAGLNRILLFFISISTVFAVLLIIPNAKNKILSKGKNSLYVYVWHGFFIKVLTGTAIISAVGNYPSITGLTILFCMSLFLTLIFSHEFIAKKTQLFIIGPVQSLIFKKS